VKSRPRKSFIAGVSLIAVALLVMVVAALYVAFAPRVFSSAALVMITFGPPKNRPARLDELPLRSFSQDRNLIISQGRGSAVIKIDAFAAGPETAAVRANQCVSELSKVVRSQMTAQFSILATAVPYSRPVRPAKQKIFVTSAIVALNLAIAGTTCLVVGFFGKRRQPSTEQVPLQVPT
jgi:hypothetical protein